MQHSEARDTASLVCLQIGLGVSWSLGVIFTALFSLRQSRDLTVAKVYLCQIVLLLAAVTMALSPLAKDITALTLFTVVYGFLLGAYNFFLKTHLLERVRSRDFSRSMALLQGCQGIALILGLSLQSWMILRDGRSSSAASLAAGSLALAAMVLMAQNCYAQRRGKVNGGSLALRRGTRNRKTQTALTECTCDAGARVINNDEDDEDDDDSPYRRGGGFFLRRGDAGMGPTLVWIPASGIDPEDDFYDNMVILADETYAEYLCRGGATIGGLDSGEDNLIVDDDNITSCNKVERGLCESEFEMNLHKETEGNRPPQGTNSKTIII